MRCFRLHVFGFIMYLVLAPVNFTLNEYMMMMMMIRLYPFLPFRFFIFVYFFCFSFFFFSHFVCFRFSNLARGSEKTL